MIEVQSFSDLRQLEGMTDGMRARVLGRSHPKDGGGGVFTWHEADTEADDGGLVVRGNNEGGRWRRDHERHKVDVKWFGAKGADGPDGDDDAGVQGALAAVRRIATDPCVSTGATLFFPNGTYKLTETLVLDRCFTLKGEYQDGWAFGAYLKWTANVHGIVVPKGAHEGHDKGDASTIEGLFIVGPDGSTSRQWTDAEYDDAITSPGSTMFNDQPNCGVVIHANGVRVRDCYIANWSGDGIHIEAVGASKNANDWHVAGVTFSACGRHGLFAAGENANAGHGERIKGTGALGGYTIYDRSFLGNTYVACHSEGARHSYYSQEGVSSCTFTGCYQETSDGPAKLGSGSYVFGGTWGNGIIGHGGGMPTIIASIPGEGSGFLRGAFKGVTATAIRRYSPTANWDVMNVTPGVDETIIVDNPGHYHTVIIPFPTPDLKGYAFTFKRIDANGHWTRLACNAHTGFKLDGVENGTLDIVGGETVTLKTDGIDWHVMSRRP